MFATTKGSAMSLFNKAFQFTEDNEGGFVDDPRDKGGATIAGVSSKYFPDDFQQIINAPNKEAQQKLIKDFYLREFWNPLYEQLIDKKLAIRLFDLGVNIWTVRAVKLLQNGLHIPADGIFGQGTLKVANNDEYAYEKLIHKAEDFYKSRKDFNIYGKGWINRLYKPITV